MQVSSLDESFCVMLRLAPAQSDRCAQIPTANSLHLSCRNILHAFLSLTIFHPFLSCHTVVDNIVTHVFHYRKLCDTAWAFPLSTPMANRRQQLTYRRQTFTSPRLSDTAAVTRYAAVRTFLFHQPEIQNEQISIQDFEFLWHAAEVSFKTTPAPDRFINIPTQRMMYPPNCRWRWHRTNIPLAQYFLEVFVFLSRKAILSTMPDLDAARSLLQQPCDIQTGTCSYANNLWYCFVPASRNIFFEELILVLTRTACYQQEVWPQAAWQDLWDTIQTATYVQDSTASITLNR